MRTSRDEEPRQQPDQQLMEQVNTMGRQSTPNDDMPAEIDSCKWTRCKFFKPGAAVNLSVNLDADVQVYLSARAKARSVEVGQFVNELLKKDIKLLEAAR